MRVAKLLKQNQTANQLLGKEGRTETYHLHKAFFTHLHFTPSKQLLAGSVGQRHFLIVLHKYTEDKTKTVRM